MTSGITAWIDGGFIDCSQASVSLLSHSFSRGSAIFEVMAISSAVRGPAFFCLEDHIDRFYSSAEQSYMNLPFSRDVVREALVELAARNRIAQGLAKFYAFYPDIELGTTPSDHLSVAVFCLDYSHPSLRWHPHKDSVSVGISRYRKLHPDTSSVHAKIAGNYVNGYLARMEIRQRGFEDARCWTQTGSSRKAPRPTSF